MAVNRNELFSPEHKIDPGIVEQSYLVDAATGRPVGQSLQDYLAVQSAMVLLESFAKWFSETRVGKRISAWPSR